MKGRRTSRKYTRRMRKSKFLSGVQSIYPKSQDSICFYFKSLATVNFVTTNFISTSAAVDSILVDPQLVALYRYFTSYRVESVKFVIMLPEVAGLFEIVTATWDQDTNTNSLGTKLFAGTQTYSDIVQLQNVRSHYWNKSNITATWRMNKSLTNHTEMVPIPENTIANSAASYQGGGVVMAVVADVTQAQPAARIQVTYKVRFSGRKNL